MRKLFFDIETIPAEEEKHGALREIYEKRISDGKKVVSEFDDFIMSTSFDGGFGRICCISYARNDEKVKTLCGAEKEILRDFWEIAKTVDLFIGFNVFDFDLRFIYQRSVIHGIQPTRELSFVRYRNSPIYDIMYEWVKWGKGNISLDALARALLIPTSKGKDIEGKNVAQAFKEGRLSEICLYCEKDVEVTRHIYKRMIFEVDPNKLSLLEDDLNF